MTPMEKLEEIVGALGEFEAFTRFPAEGTENERVHGVAVRALTLARELKAGAKEGWAGRSEAWSRGDYAFTSAEIAGNAPAILITEATP